MQDLVSDIGDIHHIFPKAYLKKNGFEKSKYNVPFLHCAFEISNFGQSCPTREHETLEKLKTIINT